MEVYLTPWQQLAVAFRSQIEIARTPVVSVISPEGTPASEIFWFSYYARTALPWCGDPNCDVNGFPRSRIYSFLGKPLEYLWVPDEHVRTIEGTPRIVMQHIPADTFGCYSLLKFKRTAADDADIDTGIRAGDNSCKGGFSARFLDRTDIDKVACEVLGLHADGKADGLVEVQIPDIYRRPRTTRWFLQQSGPLHMDLLRSVPPGIYQTDRTNFVLGVSNTPEGKLLNRPDGTAPDDLISSRFYLHFCRDGHDEAGSSYRVTIGKTTFPVQK
jgi:hypothetical protein